MLPAFLLLIVCNPASQTDILAALPHLGYTCGKSAAVGAIFD